MLATLLALPRSGSNRYTLRRRGRGGRNIFRNIQEAVGGDGDFLGFCCRPLSASFQEAEPRNTGGTSFHFYYTVSPARPVSFFFVVYTLSQFLGGGIPLESRIKGRSANWITITIGRDCGETQLQLILRNTVWTKHKPITVHRFDQEEERGARKKNIYVYICIRISWKKEREVSRDHLLLYIIPNVYPPNGFIQRHDVCCVYTVRCGGDGVFSQSFSMNEIGARSTVLSMEYRCRGGVGGDGGIHDQER